MKPVASVTAIFLLLIAVAHVARLIFRIGVSVDGTTIPLWASVVAAAICAALAAGLWREQRH